MSRHIYPEGLTSEKPTADAPEVIRPGGVLSRPTLVCLLILTILAVLGALYVGKDVVLPLILAVLFKLLLQPVVDVREEVHQLAALEDICLIPCEEFADLERAIANYKALASR